MHSLFQCLRCLQWFPYPFLLLFFALLASSRLVVFSLQQSGDVTEARLGGIDHEFEQDHLDVAQVHAGRLQAHEIDVD